jgi:hypothetical protein
VIVDRFSENISLAVRTDVNLTFDNGIIVAAYERATSIAELAAWKGE